MNKSLESKINKFLEKKVKSDGSGWPRVEYADLSHLYEIVWKLVESKWEKDIDGDSPIKVILVDRTSEFLTFTPVPYPHKAKTQAEMRDYIRTVSVNLSLAESESKHAFRYAEELVSNKFSGTDNL